MVTFTFNVIVPPKSTYSYWLVIIFSFMLKEILGKYLFLKVLCFYSFIFFFQSKKASYIFNWSAIYLLFQSKKISYIFNYVVFYFLNLFQALEFLSSYFLKKIIIFFKKNKSVLYSFKKRLKILSLE